MREKNKSQKQGSNYLDVIANALIELNRNNSFISDFKTIIVEQGDHLLGENFENFFMENEDQIIRYLKSAFDNEITEESLNSITQMDKQLELKKQEQIIKARLHAAIQKIVSQDKNSEYYKAFVEKQKPYKALKQFKNIVEESEKNGTDIPEDKLPTLNELKKLFHDGHDAAESGMEIGSSILNAVIKIKENGLFDYINSKEAAKLKMHSQQFYDAVASLYNNRDKISGVTGFANKLLCCARLGNDNVNKTELFMDNFGEQLQTDTSPEGGDNLEKTTPSTEKEQTLAIKTILKYKPSILKLLKNDPKELANIVSKGAKLIAENKADEFRAYLNEQYKLDGTIPLKSEKKDIKARESLEIRHSK